MAGLVLAAWMALTAVAVPVVKRIALFAAAPFVGLSALVYYGFEAVRK